VKRAPLVDISPSSLTVLEITEIEDDHHPDILVDFSQFVQHRAFFPRLERITPYADEDPQDSLSQEYEIAGVDLKRKIDVPQY
jgi:hypothetical protein